MSWAEVSKKIDASSIKVLVVDDEPLLREFMTRFLMKEGFQVDTAEHGLDACDKLEADTFHLIVSDIRMPEMDGSELLDHVAKNHKEIPIIMMTGYSDLSLADALSKGAKAVLSKPFKGDILMGAVADALSPQKERWAVTDQLEGEPVEFSFESLEKAREEIELEFGNGGFKIKCAEQLHTNSDYVFKFSFNDGNVSDFAISGKIKWETLREADQIEYGVQITAADGNALEFLLEKLNIQEKTSFIPAA